MRHYYIILSLVTVGVLVMLFGGVMLLIHSEHHDAWRNTTYDACASIAQQNALSPEQYIEQCMDSQ